MTTTPTTNRDAHPNELAIVMSGGGARAAYQVGFLRAITRELPDLEPEILTGVSAGAINATYLASRPGTFAERVNALADLWSGLHPDQVMRTGAFGLGKLALMWALRLAAGGRYRPRGLRGLIDTQPLRELLHGLLAPSGEVLPGVQERIDGRGLKAIAITASSYSTGQSITFFQGRDVVDWERPNRRSRMGPLTVEHVMASSALPLLFPAVRLSDGWYGDGGIRLTSPLSPAIHLGAARILAISTRFGRSAREADQPVIDDYPPPAQVASLLLNAIFLDQLDGDALRLQVTNRLLKELPPEERGTLRPVELQIWRPSQDLGRCANDYEACLPRPLRFLSRGAGTLETRSNDLLSLIMFQSDYLTRLVEIGEHDARLHMAEILPFMDPDRRASSVGSRA